LIENLPSIERRRPVKRMVFALLAVAICWPAAACCDDQVMGVGFQFSATSPQGPDDLTDIAKTGLHFRTFYRVMKFSRNWQVVAEFGYDSFWLRESEFADLIAPALADSINALFPLGPSLPSGSVATVTDLTVSGGDLNAMHVTGGIHYVFDIESQKRLQPYLTAQGGYYSTGQSDADVTAEFNVDRPGAMPDTTLNISRAPFVRDYERDNAFGLNVGGGAEFSLFESVALVGDFRYHVAFTDDKRTTFLEAGLGLVYFLGF
jgi:opacity protein-like surface antigen